MRLELNETCRAAGCEQKSNGTHIWTNHNPACSFYKGRDKRVAPQPKRGDKGVMENAMTKEQQVLADRLLKQGVSGARYYTLLQVAELAIVLLRERQAQ